MPPASKARHPGQLGRKLVLAVIGLVGFLVLVAAALLAFVDPNLYKARLEAGLSAAAGMEVRIGGRLRVGFLPLRVTLDDVHFGRQAADVVSAKEATIAIAPMSAFAGEMRIESIVLKNPVIVIERDLDGRFNIEGPREGAHTLPAVNWPKVSVTDGSIVYLDKRFGKAFEGRDCRLEMRHLQLSGGPRANLARSISFTAQAGCKQVRKDGVTLADVELSADMKDGVIDFEPVTTRVFDTQGSGNLHVDLSGPVPHYRADYTLSQFPVEALFKTLQRGQIAAGRMDFSGSLSTQGWTVKELRQGLNGQISLRGKNLTLSGSDLDRAFERFESSQNFNLVDVGAFFFAGPLGLVVTKGYDFARVTQAQVGSSEISALISDWKIERGLARAQDVAMATKENRIALQGRLDLVNDRFDDVTMALVDAKGCVKVQQKLRGTFQDPVVEKPALVTALAGPALRLLRKGSDLLTGAGCDVFYAGAVAASK